MYYKTYYKISSTKNYFIKNYLLENIPYDTIVCEAIKFCLKIYTTNLFETSFVWKIFFGYLINTTYPVKEMLEKQNYLKGYIK